MKRSFFKSISLVLTFILILGIMPISVFAANNENVLTSVSHTSAISSAVNAGSKTVTLTVPYNYTGNIVLSSGLDITFDKSVYDSASANFPDGAEAVVGGEAVRMLIIYQRKGAEALFTTEYSVSVVRESQTNFAFSGSIAKLGFLPNVITFTAADFSEKYVKSDVGALASIVITGSDPSFGYLKLGSASAMGKTITMAELLNGNLTFVPNNAGTVSYVVSAYASGTEASVGFTILTITVNEALNAGNVVYETDENVPVIFESIDFSNSFHMATGKTLSYVKFSLPASGLGTLYYRSGTVYESAVSAGTNYYANTNPNISNITFVPFAGFSGTVSVPYTGYSSDGSYYSGTLTIAVNDNSIDNIVYTADENTPVSFNAADFNAVCAEVTGETLSYVKFTLPALTDGRLYYNYRTPTDYDSRAGSETKYYNSYNSAERYLSNVDFVPAAGFTGTVNILYTGYIAANVSFSGEIVVNIGEEEDSDHFGDVGENVSWAVKAIDYLYEQGISTGDGTGYYNPQASISKGDFILMLCRAFDLGSGFSDNFSDVSKGDYFYDALGTVKKLGIAKGSNGKFNPRSALSRQDAMVLIERALEFSGIELLDGSDSDLRSFTDKHKISDYALDAFENFVKAGIIEGSGKALNPNSSVSRAEIAVILYRVLTMLKEL